MALEHEPDVLAQRVGDEVEVARPGAHALGLRPLDVVLEPVQPAADAARPREPEDELGRLDVDGHLVAVVLAAVMEAVDRRPDGRAQDRAALDDLLAVHRFTSSGWVSIACERTYRT